MKTVLAFIAGFAAGALAYHIMLSPKESRLIQVDQNAPVNLPLNK